MDNLALLKLLGEALSKTQSTSREEKSTSSPFNLNKILEALRSFSAKKNEQTTYNGNQNEQNKTEENHTKDNQKPTPKVTSPPLQSKMLGTMQSHDVFIKRVMAKNPPT